MILYTYSFFQLWSLHPSWHYISPWSAWHNRSITALFTHSSIYSVTKPFTHSLYGACQCKWV